MSETKKLIEQAHEIFRKNQKPEGWFGRCIFLSWYCDLGTCDFCFRSTIRHKARYAKTAKRELSAILAEALISKNLGWRIEFLTGGYRIFSFNEMLDITKKIHQIYEQKLWINLGTIEREKLLEMKPFVEGVCASIETINPELHDRICPDKPIEPYSKMLFLAKELGFKTSMTIVIGLGEKQEDFPLLERFIDEHKLDRITFYALKPVKGTRYTKSPEADDYAWWIAKTRIRFPNIEIIAGLTPKKGEEYAGLILKAGANAITKFPIVKKFNSRQAQEIERQAKSDREFKGTLTKMPEIDWNSEIEKLPFEQELKADIKQKIRCIVSKMKGEKNTTIISDDYE